MYTNCITMHMVIYTIYLRICSICLKLGYVLNCFFLCFRQPEVSSVHSYGGIKDVTKVTLYAVAM